MLGEKLGEFRGKVTSTRVLPAEASGPKFETTVEIGGTILGVEATLFATYWSTVRADGSLYGECPDQGIITTADGSVGTWSSAGAGRFTGKGTAVSFRGAAYFHVASSKLSRLNGIAALYELEIDENGGVTVPFWEWK